MHAKPLGHRLGLTLHCSPLGYKLATLRSSGDHRVDEEWLLDVANARGANVVQRFPGQPLPDGSAVDPEALSNEELVVALCQPHRRDLPQILRPAAQLVSRGAVDARLLALVAKRERAAPILRALAEQALRVDPSHATWKSLRDLLLDVPPLRDSILHWTRLAEPVPVNGVCRGQQWRLVS